jgi:hypothetical protein
MAPKADYHVFRGDNLPTIHLEGSTVVCPDLPGNCGSPSRDTRTGLICAVGLVRLGASISQLVSQHSQPRAMLLKPITWRFGMTVHLGD